MTSTHHAMDRRNARHRGDLHRALVSAGLELARGGGSEAVILREVSRRAEVSPAATYRHFANRAALVDAVVTTVDRRWAAVIREDVEGARSRVAEADDTTRTVEVILAACRGYLDFALNEPGWFDVCGSASDSVVRSWTGGRVPGQDRDDGEDAVWPATVGQVFEDVTRLPRSLGWTAGITSEGVRVAVCSVLHGFCLAAGCGSAGFDDRSDRSAVLLDLIGAGLQHALVHRPDDGEPGAASPS